LFCGYTYYELAILCVAKSCGELTMAQSEFSSPMYIYITIGGSTGGGMGGLAIQNMSACRNRSSIVALFR